jgi:EthD domain
MIRRISVVQRRPDISRDEFIARWTGEHAEVASRLEGLRGYVIYFARDEGASFDGMAVTSFDSREAAERAFSDPAVAEDLRRTREEFAASVEVCFADEHVVVAET